MALLTQYNWNNFPWKMWRKAVHVHDFLPKTSTAIFTICTDPSSRVRFEITDFRDIIKVTSKERNQISAADHIRSSIKQNPENQQWLSPSICTIFFPSRLPIVTCMVPILVSLNIPIASEWVRPATDLPLTEKISSPEKAKPTVRIDSYEKCDSTNAEMCIFIVS